MKFGIDLDSKTIWNILQTFRRNGKIRKSLTWKKFLKMHIKSIYAMDFFTVDTIGKMRYYVLLFISHKTREVLHFAITLNPIKEFVRQQLMRLVEKVNGQIYLIRDNGS